MNKDIDRFEEDYFRSEADALAEYRRKKREKELEALRSREENEEPEPEQIHLSHENDDEIDFGDFPDMEVEEIDTILEADSTKPVGESDEILSESITYNVDKKVVALNVALIMSRKRNPQDSMLSLEDRMSSLRSLAEEFFSRVYSDDIVEVLYPLSYPEDYAWVDGYYKSSDSVVIGCHDEDTEDNLEDNQINAGTSDWIDINTEFEVNFQKALCELRGILSQDRHYGVITNIDLVMCIPYSQKEVAVCYEIRLVDFFIEQKIRPRITICFYDVAKIMPSRALINISMIMFKNPFISKS